MEPYVLMKGLQCSYIERKGKVIPECYARKIYGRQEANSTVLNLGT
jgi:hypothetical protein